MIVLHISTLISCKTVYISTKLRDFVLSLVSDGVVFNEAIMNLPQSATDFLDVFIGLSNRKDKTGNRYVNDD